MIKGQAMIKGFVFSVICLSYSIASLPVWAAGFGGSSAGAQSQQMMKDMRRKRAVQQIKSENRARNENDLITIVEPATETEENQDKDEATQSPPL